MAQIEKDNNARRHRLEIMTSIRKKIRSLPGNWETVFKGSGFSVAGVREYESGDELKSIHWPSLARTGEIHILERSPLRQLQVFLAIDSSSSTNFLLRPKIIVNTSLMIAGSADFLRIPWGAVWFSQGIEEKIPVFQGGEKIEKLAKTLFLKEDSPTLKKKIDFNIVLKKTSEFISRGSLFFFVSDFLFPLDFKKIKEFSSIFDFVPVILFDTKEFPEIKKPVLARVACPETLKNKLVYLTPELLKDLRAKEELRIRDIVSRFRNLKIESVVLDSDDPEKIFEKLSDLFRRKIKRT